MVEILLLTLAVAMYFYHPWQTINRANGEIE